MPNCYIRTSIYYNIYMHYEYYNVDEIPETGHIHTSTIRLLHPIIEKSYPEFEVLVQCDMPDRFVRKFDWTNDYQTAELKMQNILVNIDLERIE